MDSERCQDCDSDHDVMEVPIQNYNEIAVFPLCTKCLNDKVTACPDCKEYLWQDEGIRVFNSPLLYCRSCAKHYPHIAEDLNRAARRDEVRDSVNEARR